jgi:hypothetical protein
VSAQLNYKHQDQLRPHKRCCYHLPLPLPAGTSAAAPHLAALAALMMQQNRSLTVRRVPSKFRVLAGVVWYWLFKFKKLTAFVMQQNCSLMMCLYHQLFGVRVQGFSCCCCCPLPGGAGSTPDGAEPQPHGASCVAVAIADKVVQQVAAVTAVQQVAAITADAARYRVYACI